MLTVEFYIETEFAKGAEKIHFAKTKKNTLPMPYPLFSPDLRSLRSQIGSGQCYFWGFQSFYIFENVSKTSEIKM